MKKTMIQTQFVLFLWINLVGVSAFALTSTEIQEQIEAQMRQRHPNPSEDFWQQLGSGAVPVLKQMYAEAKDGYTKSWLIDGMRYFDDPDLTALMKSQISGTDEDLLKKKMLKALIQSQGDQALDFVEPYLKDQDPHIRLAVAQAMKSYTTSDRAQKRLTSFEEQEKIAWVKDGLKEKPKDDRMVVQREQVRPAPTPLPEKDWVGDWKGVYITPDKNGAAILTLTRDPTNRVKWKLQLKVPKQTKKDLSEKDVEIVYSQTANAHWLEVRNRKTDSIFIARRKIKK